MNYKQNEKINQVKESTLVVGIDIGSTTQYARAFDWRGIELGKVFPFSNSREGFESFKAWMQHLQDKYKKLDAIVGIEPTGHYWFDLCLLYTSMARISLSNSFNSLRFSFMLVSFCLFPVNLCKPEISDE